MSSEGGISCGAHSDYGCVTLLLSKIGRIFEEVYGR